ncbi:GL12827 [Drosophila persimilis]|uniref:Snurportin-1 n=1 Tax=Drosophila persimilis TaxID=7234 RepID=B4HDM9_DROPE|nr:GL12827 [Drosophila persimilis]
MSSNYQDLYKKSLDRGEQQKLRQQELLKQQKLRRQQVQDDARPINKTEESPTKQHRKQRGKDKGTPFRLQLSEWLRNKPDNLVEWLLVPCPVGKRCMVIATNGKTKVYNKAGKQFMTLQEILQKHPIWTENQPKLDGFLFYHKEASYVCGTTPLVCWLFSYMLPDVLDLPLKEQRKQQAKESVKKSREKKEQDENPETSMETNKEEEDGDSDEYAGLKSLLDHQRRLELGELDMDCEETPSAS